MSSWDRVAERHWPVGRYQEWLADALARSLLRTESAGAVDGLTS
jgi:hypothetical protein